LIKLPIHQVDDYWSVDCIHLRFNIIGSKSLVILEIFETIIIEIKIKESVIY